MSYTLDAQTVISADLDGTLAESKMPLSPEMGKVISDWLETNRFAIISGGKYEQFLRQVVNFLPTRTHFENLFLFPTNGAAFYHFNNSTWEEVYNYALSKEELENIHTALKEAVAKSGIVFEKLYGEQIEERGGQVTFSALGQEAPIDVKTTWDPDQEKRKKIVSFLSPLLPDLTVAIGGATSIDIVKKGIDKAYAIRKMEEHLNVDTAHIIFLGDAIFPGGNDYPSISTGVSAIKVSGPDEAQTTIKNTTIALREGKI